MRAFGYSFEGLKAASKHPAFRTELLIGVPMMLVSLFMDKTPAEHALLIASILLVWMVELLNTGIESAIDRIGLEIHPLSKQAKDMGSAAVLISILCAGAVWLLVVLG
jgi:diacylglycerol kinase (ATP)